MKHTPIQELLDQNFSQRSTRLRALSRKIPPPSAGNKKGHLSAKTLGLAPSIRRCRATLPNVSYEVIQLHNNCKKNRIVLGKMNAGLADGRADTHLQGLGNCGGNQTLRTMVWTRGLRPRIRLMCLRTASRIVFFGVVPLFQSPGIQFRQSLFDRDTDPFQQFRFHFIKGDAS